MSNEVKQLVDRAEQARRQNRLGDARRDLIRALTLARQRPQHDVLVLALKRLGRIEHDLGHDDAALSLYSEAVTICRQHDNPLVLAHTVRHLGDIHRRAGRLDSAEPCYREALALYRAEAGASSLDVANTLRPLAILRHAMDCRQEATQLFEQARDLYAAVGVEEGVAECQARLAGLGG